MGVYIWTVFPWIWSYPASDKNQMVQLSKMKYGGLCLRGQLPLKGTFLALLIYSPQLIAEVWREDSQLSLVETKIPKSLNCIYSTSMVDKRK